MLSVVHKDTPVLRIMISRTMGSFKSKDDVRAAESRSFLLPAEKLRSSSLSRFSQQLHGNLIDYLWETRRGIGCYDALRSGSRRPEGLGMLPASSFVPTLLEVGTTEDAETGTLAAQARQSPAFLV